MNDARSREHAAQTRAALVIAHPGHELRVHAWLGLAKPAVSVLTQGCGRSGRSRLASTTRVLAETGATIGPVYGRFPDDEAYDAVLKGNYDIFTVLVDELARGWLAAGIDTVASDMSEAYNSMHEVCRMLVNAAVERAQKKYGRTVLNLQFPLIHAPDGCPAEHTDSCIHLTLTDDELEKKLRAAFDYTEIQKESGMDRAKNDPEYFRIECLWPAAASSGFELPAGIQTPDYEHFGRKRVESGISREIITYERHLRPLGDAIRRSALI